MQSRRGWSLYAAFVIAFMGACSWNASRLAQNAAWQAEQDRLEYVRYIMTNTAQMHHERTRYYRQRRIAAIARGWQIRPKP